MNGLKAHTLLQWLVPALLTATLAGIGATFSRVASMDGTLHSLDRRVIAIENSRFTTTDGLEVWRELDTKVDRDELTRRLDRIEAILDEMRQQ